MQCSSPAVRAAASCTAAAKCSTLLSCRGRHCVAGVAVKAWTLKDGLQHSKLWHGKFDKNVANTVGC